MSDAAAGTSRESVGDTARETRSRLTDPAAHVPSGTTVRFAILVVTLIASTGSFFAYFWQVAHPAAQTQVGQCLARISNGGATNLITASGPVPVKQHLALVLCLQSSSKALTAWAAFGVALLILGTAMVFLITPWWLTNRGAPGRRGRLVPFDEAAYPDHTRQLAYLVERAGLGERRPKFLVDERCLATGARVFGVGRQAFVRLDGGLVALHRGHPADPKRAKFSDIVLHELGHIRNRDNRSTYLTVAAWRTYYVLIVLGYAGSVVVSARVPVLPDFHTLVVLLALFLLVPLSVRAVLRTRELHADATAAFCHPRGTLGLFQDPPSANRPAWTGTLRAWVSFHPSLADRDAALGEPERLFRPSAVTMATAGIAVAMTIGALNPTVISVLLSSRLVGLVPVLTTSAHASLLLVLKTFGPAVTVTTLLISGLLCAEAWRLHHLRQCKPGVSHFAFLPAAATFAIGMVAGTLLGFDNALAGTWGLFDTTAAANLIVLALSLLLLMAISATMGAWAMECAAVWLVDIPTRTRARMAFVGAVVIGAIGFAPAFLSWAATAGTPWSDQWQFGPTAAENPLIGTWPLVRLLFVHPEVLGTYDDVPGAAGALGFACLFVVAGAWLRRPGTARPGMIIAAHSPRDVGATAIVLTGLASAIVAGGLGLEILLALRSAVGTGAVSSSGGYGLDYLTRALEALSAVIAAIGAALLTRKADLARLSSAILASLIAITAVTLSAPELLYIGFLGLHHKPVNPQNGPIFVGLFGHAASVWALAATVFLVALVQAPSARHALTRRGNDERSLELQVPPASPRIPEKLRVRLDAGAIIVICAIFALVIQAAYYYYTRDFNG